MVTDDLLAQANAMTPDVRTVLLYVADHGPSTHTELAAGTGLTPTRVHRACEALQRGYGYLTVRTTHEYGLGLHGSGEVLAEAARVAEGRLSL